MQEAEIRHCLRYDLLRFVRDNRPSVEEILDLLGPAESRVYHVLRKARLLVVQEGVVLLSPDHLSGDGKCFAYQNLRFHLDEDRIDVYRMVSVAGEADDGAAGETQC